MLITMTKIISWNVNGIRAVIKKGCFSPFVAEFEPDILALQETKAEQGQAEIDLPEFEEYWNSSTRKKGYSGTAIFTRTKPEKIILGFPTDLVEKYKLNEDGYGDPNTEGRVITAQYKDFFLVNSYTPNSKPDLSRLPLRHKQWDPAFLEYMKRLDKELPVIFTGDLNVAHTPDDLANPKANEGGHGFTKEEREGIDNIIKAGFVDAYRKFYKGNGKYTWWSHFAHARERNVGWRIDYFFVSERIMNKISKVEILDHVLGSDHCPVLLELKDK